MSKKNFLKGAAILGVAGIVTKVLGAFYRIPLSNLIGTEGIGYYQVAYSLYTLLLAISTSGFPTAIAKLIAEKRAKEDYSGASNVFKVSLIGFLVVGSFTALIIGLFAKKLVSAMGNEGGYYALIALAPALLFVPILSAFRGYFQGKQEMIPIAISQTLEQLLRVVTGLTMVSLMLNRGMGLQRAAGGASLGGSIGAAAGTIVIILFYVRERKNRELEKSAQKESRIDSKKEIAKKILGLAIPITLGAAIAPIINMIDTVLVNHVLGNLGYSAKESTALFGQLTGNAQTLINFPQVISTALAMSLVPVIAEANALKDKEKIRTTSKSGIRISLFFGLPATIGLIVLASPIIRLLYFSNSEAEKLGSTQLLQILPIGLVFLIILQTSTAILQGIGKPLIPVKNLGIGLIIKVVLTYVLTSIPSLNVKGAAIATVVTYLIASVLTYKDLYKLTKVKLGGIKPIGKIMGASLGMGVVCYLSYVFISNIIDWKIAMILSIGIAFIVYSGILVLTKAFDREDLENIPKGEKIVRILEKWGRI